ncbi:hypothetical protein FM076_17770 [Streptomyces albus subsp. chlorinus]|uniref:hypothetical protein n=1 Tax=Streptomyces albus TaxID=1888 RepID=UPI00156E01C1|nr:hypothetical protein [Streptomyces albus]NSC22919.1 hypothetical protein [Streptomyces albus subsp. chlorinus]
MADEHGRPGAGNGAAGGPGTGPDAGTGTDTSAGPDSGTGTDTGAGGTGEVGGAREVRRRRIAAAGWVCAVGAAFALGAWSFSQADPGGRYARPEPLTDDGVRHELAQSKERARTRSPEPSASPSAGRTPDGTPVPSRTEPPRRPVTRTGTVRFPDGLGTALAECRTDARTVKLLSWTPAEGYSVDDVDPGPARSADVELEPAADGAADPTVHVRCLHGKPRATVTREADSDEDDD